VWLCGGDVVGVVMPGLDPGTHRIEKRRLGDGLPVEPGNDDI
jgi:hypothetical protein